jgi:RimJ/RimL family protein N-acetyltransferase
VSSGHLGAVTLRPLRDGEELVDSSSVWDDWGLRDSAPPADLGRMVVDENGVAVGDVTWHSVWYGPNSASRAYNIGISLAPAARGRGIGSLAQRLLVAHLFATTDVGRVEASTDVENFAEQRSLEKAGFAREGVLRSAQGRADGRHDLVVYSFVRADLLGVLSDRG